MAKNDSQSSFLAQVWWIMLSVLALTFGGILATIGGLTVTGKVKKETFFNMAEVIRGTHVALPKEDVAELVALRLAEEERNALAIKEKGGLVIRGRSLEAEQVELTKLTAERAVLKERLQREMEDLKMLRSQVDAGMLEADRKRIELNEARALAAKNDLAEDTTAFDRTLSTLDAEVISRDLTEMVRAGKSGNAARLLKKLKPGKRAEILGEMNTEARLTLLPLLENQYATIDPEKVVQDWQAKGMAPEEYQLYLESMPARQAFQVWRNLERTVRNDVLEMMAPAPKGGGGQ